MVGDLKQQIMHSEIVITQCDKYECNLLQRWWSWIDLPECHLQYSTEYMKGGYYDCLELNQRYIQRKYLISQSN